MLRLWVFLPRSSRFGCHGPPRSSSSPSPPPSCSWSERCIICTTRHWYLMLRSRRKWREMICLVIARTHFACSPSPAEGFETWSGYTSSRRSNDGVRHLRCFLQREESKWGAWLLDGRETAFDCTSHTSALPSPLRRTSPISSSSRRVHSGQGRSYGRASVSRSSSHVAPWRFRFRCCWMAALNST